MAEKTSRVFIGNTQHATEANIQAHFQQYGTITQELHIPTDPATGNKKFFGFITFETVEAAEAAIGASPHTVDGAELVCKTATERGSGGGGGMMGGYGAMGGYGGYGASTPYGGGMGYGG